MGALILMHAGRGVLMEFYAAWCPACKHFQPHYDKVAAYFYGTPRPKPEVYVARVDCATEVRGRPSHTSASNLSSAPRHVLPV